MELQFTKHTASRHHPWGMSARLGRGFQRIKGKWVKSLWNGDDPLGPEIKDCDLAVAEKWLYTLPQARRWQLAAKVLGKFVDWDEAAIQGAKMGYQTARRGFNNKKTKACKKKLDALKEAQQVKRRQAMLAVRAEYEKSQEALGREWQAHYEAQQAAKKAAQEEAGRQAKEQAAAQAEYQALEQVVSWYRIKNADKGFHTRRELRLAADEAARTSSGPRWLRVYGIALAAHLRFGKPKPEIPPEVRWI